MDYTTPWYAKSKAITAYIVIGAVIAVFAVISMTLGGVNNTYVTKDQNVATAKSNISKEEQRRVDLFNNLVDAVESYNQFEQATLEKVIQARQQASGGQIENAQLTLAAVVEQYPELKSQANYKIALTEFSVTENRLAGYREQYNNDTRDFNIYVQSFPAGVFLSVLGKDKSQKPLLDYKVDNTEARNLFK